MAHSTHHGLYPPFQGKATARMTGVAHLHCPKFELEPTTTEVIFLVLNFVLAFIVLFCVGALSLYQLYCLSMNRSAIESWECGNVEKLVRRGKIKPVEYPFDMGLYRNICDVLGSNPLLWLWPQKLQSDGLTFPVRDYTGKAA